MYLCHLHPARYEVMIVAVTTLVVNDSKIAEGELMLFCEVLESYLAEHPALTVAELFPSLSRAQSHYLSVMMRWEEKGACRFSSWLPEGTACLEQEFLLLRRMLLPSDEILPACYGTSSSSSSEGALASCRCCRVFWDCIAGY